MSCSTVKATAAKPSWGRAAACKRSPTAARCNVQPKAQMKALIFDCDGVILESEGLHRIAYNAAFDHFQLKNDGEQVEWAEEYYDMLQNQVGGGKPKMRWHFKATGWPATSITNGAVPSNETEQDLIIDTVQEWKQLKFQDLIGNGSVPTRPGVLRLMDDAKKAGLLLAVCSAATKESCTFTVKSLLGMDRFERLDLFMAGNDVSKKKPDPMIYRVAAERLGVLPAECLVIEDSSIGLAAATGAGMRCMITYTDSTLDQPFPGAERIVKELGDNPPEILIEDLIRGGIVQDDRVLLNVDENGGTVTF